MPFGMSDAALRLRESLERYERLVKHRTSPIEGLTRRDFDLLIAVGVASGAGRGMRAGELVQALDITPPSLTPLIDRMEYYGLIERRPDPEDRRATIVVITAQGGALLRQSFTLIVEMFNEIAEELGDDVIKAAELLDRTTELIIAKRRAQIAAGRFPVKADLDCGPTFPGNRGFDPVRGFSPGYGYKPRDIDRGRPGPRARPSPFDPAPNGPGTVGPSGSVTPSDDESQAPESPERNDQ